MQNFIKLVSTLWPFECVSGYCNKNYTFISYDESYYVKENDILLLTSTWNKNNIQDEIKVIQQTIEKYPNNLIFYDLLGEEDFNINIQHQNLYFLYGNKPTLEKNNYFYYPYYWWLVESNTTPNEYVLNKTFEKKFLMPINRYKSWRRDLVLCLNKHLHNAIYSEVYNSKYLPNDCNLENFSDRYFNPSWYDATHYTIVAETNIYNDSIFITEKTYKPIQYFHPFLIVGSKNSLEFLKNNGFVTYENLFDESYDCVDDIKSKLKIIENNVLNYNYDKNYDKLTKEKLNHNFYHFYNSKQYLIEQAEINLFSKIEKIINSQ